MKKSAAFLTLFFFLGLLASWGIGATLVAGEFPEKALKIVIPWPSGTGPDVVNRILAELVRPELGQPVAVINVVGGSGSKGMAFVKNAPADGYTLINNWVAPHTVVPIFNPIGTCCDCPKNRGCSADRMTFGESAGRRARSCSVQICHLPGSGVLLRAANDGITLVMFSRRRPANLDTAARFLRAPR